VAASEITSHPGVMKSDTERSKIESAVLAPRPEFSWDSFADECACSWVVIR
jgi:hypothetical protein